MIKEVKNHPTDYAVLGAWLALGLIAFLLTNFSTHLQLATLIIFASGYVLWGVFHHIRNHDFHSSIVLEYMLVALLTIVIIGGILLQ